MKIVPKLVVLKNINLVFKLST